MFILCIYFGFIVYVAIATLRHYFDVWKMLTSLYAKTVKHNINSSVCHDDSVFWVRKTNLLWRGSKGQKFLKGKLNYQSFIANFHFLGWNIRHLGELFQRSWKWRVWNKATKVLEFHMNYWRYIESPEKRCIWLGGGRRHWTMDMDLWKCTFTQKPIQIQIWAQIQIVGKVNKLLEYVFAAF